MIKFVLEHDSGLIYPKDQYSYEENDSTFFRSCIMAEEAYEGLLDNSMEIYIKDEKIKVKDFSTMIKEKNEKFDLKYIVYKYYRDQGWIVKSGSQFGGEFGKRKDHFFKKVIYLLFSLI